MWGAFVQILAKNIVMQKCIVAMIGIYGSAS